MSEFDMNPGVEMRNAELELHHFRVRLGIASTFVLVMFGLLFARFFYLQIVMHDHYHTLAEANRISILPIVPNRGIIVDRNGVVLATNYSAYTLEITPSKVESLEATIDEIATLVEITPRDRRRFKKLLEESKRFESLPIRTRLSDEEIARFAANRYRFPGVDVRARLFRSYPQGELFSHVIGHIGRVNLKDLDKLDAEGRSSNYRGTDYIGKTGLEYTYEDQLHGTTGVEQVEVDSGGRAVRALSRTAPTSGSNLVLKIDARLQEVVFNAFGDRRGALVAIEPESGGVLAFVSKPGFDPNLFVDGIDQENWNELNTSPDKPMVNRALAGTYPPGSTFKPFMAMAALTYGKRTPAQSISDPGFYNFGGHTFRDDKVGGHGTVDMYKSIVASCDTYYYALANDLGIDAISRFMGSLGFGSRTGIDVAAEVVRRRDDQHRHRPGLQLVHPAAARRRDRHARQRRRDVPAAPGQLRRGGAHPPAHGDRTRAHTHARLEARAHRDDQERDGRGQQGRHFGARFRRRALHERRQDRHRAGDRPQRREIRREPGR
jgi:penicillin-binding protein 2